MSSISITPAVQAELSSSSDWRGSRRSGAPCRQRLTEIIPGGPEAGLVASSATLRLRPGGGLGAAERSAAGAALPRGGGDGFNDVPPTAPAPRIDGTGVARAGRSQRAANSDAAAQKDGERAGPTARSGAMLKNAGFQEPALIRAVSLATAFRELKRIPRRSRFR